MSGGPPRQPDEGRHEAASPPEPPDRFRAAPTRPTSPPAAEGDGGTRPGGQVEPVDVARRALLAARRASAGRSATTSARGRRDVEPVRSGAHPDRRDPALVAEVVAEIATTPTWRRGMAVGGLLARWPTVVGAQLAAHTWPESLTDGVLVVRTDSTAWATQVRLCTPVLLARLAEEYAEARVDRVSVRGPDAPSWGRGPRRVPGRGPRDTYG